MAKLLLKYQAAVIKEIQIDKTPITVGRKSDNDIIIDNMAVSGHHAKIVMVGNSYVVEDLKSTNGTFLNDQKIISAAIKHNDEISIGHHSLVFIEPEIQKHLDTDSTVVLSQEKQRQIIEQQKPKPAAPAEQPAQAKQSAPIELPAPAKRPVPVELPAPARQPAQPKQPAPVEPPAPALKGEEILKKFAAKQAKTEPGALLRVIEGKSDEIEYVLSKPMTYIGKSETAAIKIKGMFAPDIAALISKRADVYFITAVKDGYPKLNGSTFSGQMELKNNDIIEMAGIKFLFNLNEPGQKA